MDYFTGMRLKTSASKVTADSPEASCEIRGFHVLAAGQASESAGFL